MIEIKIDTTNEGQRLDKYLLKYFNKATKSFIYKIIRKKYIKINSHKAVGNEMLAQNDIISIYLADDTINKFIETKKIIQTTKDFSILYEDENIIICYKPTNLVSQPDINNKDNSLNDQLLYYMYQSGYESLPGFTPSICNRLDRNTSGIVTFGKNLKTLQALNKLFKENTIDKHYLTAVNGELHSANTIKLYHKKNDNKAILLDKYVEGTKEVITKYAPIKTCGGKTLIDVMLITGKSHQIRASFEHIGYPIIGDKKYNTSSSAKSFNLRNQFLHCYKIKFKDKVEPLGYLNGKSFVCPYMNKSFKEVLDYFDYKIKE